jgi:hypothetical protein
MKIRRAVGLVVSFVGVAATVYGYFSSTTVVCPIGAACRTATTGFFEAIGILLLAVGLIVLVAPERNETVLPR